MRTVLIILFSLFINRLSYSQEQDSVQKLKEVVVKAYLTSQPILAIPSSVSVIDGRQLSRQSGTSLLPAVNAIPGLRMEERSPGSYRLSIRGSLLRSPFGIRNVKVYNDAFPLTDAGGNTYLNLIDPESVNSIEILKGPDGSLFGANSGGVVLINPDSKQTDSSATSLSLKSGSYNLFQESISTRQKISKHFFQLNQAYQNSNGYRQNSELKRNYGQIRYSFNYKPESQIRVLALYSDLNYQTPGGLTKTQYDQQPVLARPATQALPSALEQQAGVYNKTIYTGVLHQTKIINRLSHTFAVFGSHTDFKNPFITNYEVRDEYTSGVRTFFELTGKAKSNFDWKINSGLEWQQTQAKIQNYDNNKGQKGSLQSSDDVLTRQYFYFGRFSANILNRINLEIAASVNYYRFKFKIPANLSATDNRVFKPQIMPRLAFSYKVSENVAWRNSVSRGYSPPSLAEIRASNQEINTGLQPESGWNYETGFRLRNNNDRFWLDASVFYYKLQDAIVRRVNNDDTEFFVNAGGTDQIGFESLISGWLIAPVKHGLVRGLQVRNSLTLNHFKFKNYLSAADNFSGNRLTGVPDQVIVSSLEISMPSSVTLFIQHNYTSKIPLNDANSTYSSSYNLMQFKTTWRTRLNSKTNFELFAGADNLLNQKYSLGNDLNAFGGRYFNAAPLRNYFGGIKMTL
ncbi:MAG: TonB-dependent receptor [Flavobacterium sp.]|nr:TonB-dependent receptor [Pedobacter sp.]